VLPELSSTVMLADPWKVTVAGRVFGFAKELVRT
jgi:hypothetical protein